MSIKVKDGKGNWISVTGDPVPSGGDLTSVISGLIAPTEISPSESAYEIGDYLIFDDNLYKVTSAISIGDSLIEGTNIEKTTLMEEIKNGTEPEPEPESVHIYGAEWNGTPTTRWTRTDESASFVNPVPAVNNGTGSSPFDNCSPWKDIKRQTSATSGEVVYIPKFWVKITTRKGGSILKIQIADGEAEGFVPAPAFQNRGNGRGELDYILVGRYHCCASDYKSKTGEKPSLNLRRSEFRRNIHKLGADVYQWDYAVRLTLFYLYLVEFADWNSQATIGYGCSNNSSTENMGATDAMQYHTGTAAATRTTYGNVQYRYIEGLWDNVFDYVDGIYCSGSDVYIVKNPARFSDSSLGTKFGTELASLTDSGYISAFFVGTGEYAAYIYPSETAGNDSTFVCDYYQREQGEVVFAGGSYSQSQSYGLFYLYAGQSSTDYKYGLIGSRLMELPSISY